MFDTTDAPLPITLPISASDRHQAHTFANQQPNATKAEQVYRNTLAILATQNYLQLLGIETAPQESHSWHPLHRVLGNVADLVITAVPDTLTYLDCRPVKEGDRTCFIPESAWSPEPAQDPQSTLMGHVVVQLDAPYHTAHILGFVKTVSTSTLPLNYLQPLTHLVDEFLAPVPVPEPEPEPAVIPLHQWFDGKMSQSWEQLTTALAEQWSLLQGTPWTPAMGVRSVATPTPTATPPLIRQRIADLYAQEFSSTQIPQDYANALIDLLQTTQSDETRWQAAELLWSIDPKHPCSPVMTLKDLGLYLHQQRVALMVGLFPKSDGSFLILTRICPIAETGVLPAGLMLRGCDDQQQPFFQVEARQRDQYIQFKFTAAKGDRFSLTVLCNGIQLTESFVV